MTNLSGWKKKKRETTIRRSFVTRERIVARKKLKGMSQDSSTDNFVQPVIPKSIIN